jgi:hypothetical protein
MVGLSTNMRKRCQLLSCKHNAEWLPWFFQHSAEFPGVIRALSEYHRVKKANAGEREG